MEFSKLSQFYIKRPELYQQHLKKYTQHTTTYSLISTKPPIFYLSCSPNDSGHAPFTSIFNYLQNENSYFLKTWCWDMEDTDEVEKIRQLEIQHLHQYPKHKFIHLCNTLQQQKIFQEYELNAFFCNQNSLIDERIFRPISSINKKFDAVYDAKLTRFKRHYLAKYIDSIAFVYYYDVVKDVNCYQEIKSLFPHGHFFNQALFQNYKLLPPSTVNECLNACRVGLCLSNIEGAMYASIQYLLSGLPIVSTKSKGGRDVFFDDEYVLIVADDPEAVKEGVDKLIRRNISPDYIRYKVIEKIKQHRLILINIIQGIYDQEGIPRNFALEWEHIFFNKLFQLQKPEKAIKQIELRKA
ncbi:glycosyltransferase family 1 protein [Cronbergia sp. UHCC 0137]|uniref:glycosyltransferase n=1 Tax=Cronbergia sp. UHCC 0137 TaxID=3110239 RepID=UPI002B1FB900|nr:glycosyltransferase family 1 protein [Cronbergia sp. UHCC 0137]MEA5619908.1 glycosyltransferase family 1 protein [Cronbergia sp. UHCC 0137]